VDEDHVGLRLASPGTDAVQLAHLWPSLEIALTNVLRWF
jgi:hypothetical protein